VRILQVTPRFWPAVGGAEELLGQLSRHLVADGHQVTILTTNARGADLIWNCRGSALEGADDVIDGIQVRRFPIRHLPGSPLSYSAMRRLLWIMSRLNWLPTRYLASLSRYTPWVPDLQRWLAQDEQPVDLVMGMNIAFESLMHSAAAFAGRRRVPFAAFPLTHLGISAVPGNDSLSSFYTMRHQIELVSNSDLLLAMTPTESAFYEAHGLPAERAAVVGSAIDPAELSGGDAQRFRAQHRLTQPFAFSIGTACFDKGSLYTLKAMRKLWQQGRSYHLVLAGATMPDMQRALQHLPRSERQNVHALGIISAQEKADLLAAGDLLVMPSRTESFGTVYLEAWHYGKPVIGARAWGVQDVVTHEYNGLLVHFGNIDALAHSINRLLSQPELAQRMGAHGQGTVAQYTWPQRYPILLEAYQRTVRRGLKHDAPGN